MSRTNRFPFDKDAFLPDTLRNPRTAHLLPASVRTANHSLISPTEQTHNFLKKDLMVEKLNRINQYLWLAGQPIPPRPLNYQLATSREIAVDERINMHMVWEHSRRIHLKPLPRYLLDPHFWDSHLICKQLCCASSSGGQRTQVSQECLKELYKCALGFLSSYMALIQFESDFAIAKTYHLLPHDITWDTWLNLNQQLLASDATNPANLNPRYWFGELRLSRLNKVYAIGYAGVLSGYQFTYPTYAELFHDYLNPLTAATIYVALVLMAMQAGLATNRLGTSSPFQDVSYVFTVFAILGPLIGILVVGVVGTLAFTKNLTGSWSFKRQQFAIYKQSQSQKQIS